MRTDVKVGLIAGVVVLGGLMAYATFHTGRSAQQISTERKPLEATEAETPSHASFGPSSAYGAVLIPVPSTAPATAPARDITADNFTPTTAPGPSRPNGWNNDMGGVGTGSGTGSATGTDPFSNGTGHPGGTGAGAGAGTGSSPWSGSGTGTVSGSGWNTQPPHSSGTGSHLGTITDPIGSGLTPSGTSTDGVYVIKSGDTLGKVAHANHVTLKALQDANPTADSSHLKIGQKITIPAVSTTSASGGSRGTTSGTTSGTVGGTVGGTRSGSHTKAGSTSGASTMPAAGGTYVVKHGDTLAKIAKQFYGDANNYKKILRANKDTISNEDQIKEGMTLKIPR